jgi:hypothetical protein
MTSAEPDTCLLPSLRSLTAAGARPIERWFDDLEVQHRLRSAARG